MLPYLPGSAAHKRLCEIADRFSMKGLRAQASSSFYGIIVENHSVLYRYGTDYAQPGRREAGKRQRYGRWNWKAPFGRKADWEKVDHVLLYGPPTHDADEAFFLCTMKDARRFANALPDPLNVASSPLYPVRGKRAEFLTTRKSFQQLIERLKSLK